ncbi:GNAT family N-acetyltransferase [Cellulomonas carbonis]|uniref:Acetyltransferase n=1 Tax=Cellulomonas carbonis T26 TaxID=947969 RepID=A0A0A0BLM2_9CELL|nr:GNAT family N-acetyltransferase [Cellulomonas carbonis]KGM09428.1 acetyltransferase [Cellulomonas carbonis T26]GGB95033.1 N-acetyltransferase [Cellulomonas carbonis]
MGDWTVRRAIRGDRPEWARLYAGYLEFYERVASPEHLETVWSWVESGEIVALVVSDPDRPDALVGLAHLRPFLRPVAGVVAGFMDDLFVDPANRGTGAVQELLSAVRRHAAEAGWERVRWITAESNDRARAVYDRVATATPWVTYDMTDLSAPVS